LHGKSVERPRVGDELLRDVSSSETAQRHEVSCYCRTVSSESVKPDPNARMPRQIPYIIASEGCERFSFYGMRNILTPFLTTMLLLHLPEEARRGEAKDVFHTFVMGVYFFPVLGGWLADRFFGKYNTILWFSLIYCIGHACLAIFEDSVNGFYTGLFLIALGAGGIKPLVASFVGDQFDSRTKHLAKLVFDAFYWIINFGSFFASLIMPVFLAELGPSIAFGIPGVLMFIATAVLWLGRKRYVMVKPNAHNPHSFMKVVRSALFTTTPGQGRPGLVIALVGCALAAASFLTLYWLEIVPVICLAFVVLLAFGGAGTSMQLDRARGHHPGEAVDGVRAVLRVLIVFALVTPFHSLFDQKATEWVLQGGDMQIPAWEMDLFFLGVWETNFQPAQMQAFNPFLVMLLIPFNNIVLYPWLRRRGWEPTSLRRMTWGIAFAGVAWIIAGAIQLSIDGRREWVLVEFAGLPGGLPIDNGERLNILWQVLPYALLTFGEVLVSATGLEFAYSQAPLAMKGVIMSFWNLTTTVGNLWVLLANAGVRNETVRGKIADTGLSESAFLIFFFAVFAFAASWAFHLYVRRYTVVDNYRSASGPPGGRDSGTDAAVGKKEPLPTATARKLPLDPSDGDPR
jgi:proton-dependent oligopeptide transporter, POT family